MVPINLYEGDNMKNVIAALVLIVSLASGCASSVHTRVSSISHNPIKSGSTIFLLQGDGSIESKKFAKLIKIELQENGFVNFTSLENADIVVGYSGGMLGSSTHVGSTNTPVQVQVFDPLTGYTSAQTTGYKTNTYSRTSHQREIRIQFYDGVKLRAKKDNPLLWEAVGKSSGSSSDIIAVAPQIIDSIFEEIGKDADSVKHSKTW